MESRQEQCPAPGDLARHVATLVTPPRRLRHEITPLSAAQAKSLLEAARGEWKLSMCWR